MSEHPKLIWDPKAQPTQEWVSAWNNEAQRERVPYRLRLVGGKLTILKLVTP